MSHKHRVQLDVSFESHALQEERHQPLVRVAYQPPTNIG